MAQITFDTDNPHDIQLLQSLLEAGLIHAPSTNGNGNGSGPGSNSSFFDLDEAVDQLMSAVGEDARVLLQEFVVQTFDGPATLDDVAAALKVEHRIVKGRKLNLGRSIKKVRRLNPGMPEVVLAKLDSSGKTQYTMQDDMRTAIDKWLSHHWTEDDD